MAVLIVSGFVRLLVSHMISVDSYTATVYRLPEALRENVYTQAN